MHFEKKKKTYAKVPNLLRSVNDLSPVIHTLLSPSVRVEISTRDVEKRRAPSLHLSLTQNHQSMWIVSCPTCLSSCDGPNIVRVGKVGESLWVTVRRSRYHGPLEKGECKDSWRLGSGRFVSDGSLSRVSHVTWRIFLRPWLRFQTNRNNSK